MPILLSKKDMDVRVEYGSFGIQEFYHDDVPIPYPDASKSGVFLQSFPGRLDLGSAGHTHTVSVSVEIWDSCPVSDLHQDWDEVEESVIETPTGELAVWDTGPQQGNGISLGRPGHWAVRAAAAGRAEAERQTRLTGPVHGVERWLLQFWPADA
ncbi:hypothetical protein [Streptomyces roseoverticillatus]|uniref:hypothetical protein n=1 Tax=Streptomyces roseoverticillatus TaxID=66429 RepID=UPI0012FF189C|nr:hypothetical protein [Streptomyces roseoverticillatus]